MKTIIISIILTIIFVIFFTKNNYITYYKYALLPKRKCSSKIINKILIGLPVIDRDSDICDKVYNCIEESKKKILEKYNIKFDYIIVTRITDEKCIKYWKNKGKLIIIDNYKIKNRHNWNKMVETFNIIRRISFSYDALLIVESDILLNKDTILKLYEKINKYHIVSSYFETPWSKFPLIVIGGIYPKIVNARNYNNNLILGHGTGCILIRKEVLKKCKFNKATVFGITGQDVGFFMSAFKNRYESFLINDEVRHLYNRNL
tara:strand:+ start:97 stop:879 length:783 start_codon:yes stop_codon:yes gene_type:complete